VKKGIFVFCCTWVLLWVGVAAFGQTIGTIAGGVYDKDNGEGLIGAIVKVDGTERVGFVDFDGNYEIRGLQAGTYTVTASMDGFSAMTVEDVNVTAGEVAKVDFELRVDALQESIVVTAALLENSEVGLLRQRQKSNAISDAISIEEISRSGGSTAADAVTKITGASVVGGKYVYIRGLGDRYTSTHLNGVEMPTADPESNSFQADLFPSNVLDNIVTLKSFTPDKPGNFSGGIIDVSTKSFPTSFTLDFSLSASYNEQSTFDDGFLQYPGSSSDWYGRDSGLRALPDFLDNPDLELPTLIEARRNEEKAMILDQASRAFEPVMSSNLDEAPLNRGFSISVGDQKTLFGKRLGFIATLSYKRDYATKEDWQTARWKLTEDVAEASTLINQSDFSGQEGVDEVNWGGVTMFNLTLSPEHQIGFNYVYTQSGESKSQYYIGSWLEQFQNDDTLLESRLLKYTERNLDSFQLSGDHFFPGLGDVTVEWRASTSSTEQDEPDTRIFTDHFTTSFTTGEPVYSIARSLYNDPARYFRNLQEDSDSFQLDVAIPFSQWNGMRGKVKVGYALTEKERDFFETRYEYVSESNIRYDGDPDSYFSRDNVGVLGFDAQRNRYIFGNVIQEAPDARGGNYFGTSDVQAFYAMLELPLSERLRMITGARQEQADFEVFNDDSAGILDDDDTLPSLHFIYELSDRTNLRLSYGRTLVRPTFREKAPYASFDFIADGIFQGNPDLKRTLIDNFDLRWEMFPTAGELLAASVFLKELENPIERAYNLAFASEFGEKTFLNVDAAEVYGLELEGRKRIDFLGNKDSIHIFSASGNVSFIESEVDIPPEELAFLLSRDPDASTTRKLQGQSPYLVNVGLNYDNFDSETSASLFYNVFGPRIDEVGIGGAPNAEEQPRALLDFSFTQRLWRDVTLKFVAKNLLDSDVEITQSFKGQDFTRSLYTRGRTYSFSLSYKP